ncbi:MAG: PEGA domain-containing protein [Myxococcota bacterium]|nr:PEGA domain-containing protein [Myxococcota bacterium]
MMHLLLSLSLAYAQDATVQVSANTSGGKILVDGQDSGKTAPSTLTLAPGKHTIQVNGDCLTASQQVELSPGQTLPLELELQPVGGFAEIRVSDPEATLKVDDTVVPAPAMLPLACGAHSIVASAPGMATLEQSLVVEMGGAYRLNLQLEPEAATAVVAEDPEPVETTPVEQPVATKPPEVAPPAQDTPREPTPGRGAKIAGAGIAAVGVGALATGTVIRMGTLPVYQEYAGLDTNGDGTIRSPEDASRADTMWNDQIAPARAQSMALFAIGGVCLAAGTGVLVFVDDEGRPVMGYSGTF